MCPHDMAFANVFQRLSLSIYSENVGNLGVMLAFVAALIRDRKAEEAHDSMDCSVEFHIVITLAVEGDPMQRWRPKPPRHDRGSVSRRRLIYGTKVIEIIYEATLRQQFRR